MDSAEKRPEKKKVSLGSTKAASCCSTGPSCCTPAEKKQEVKAMNVSTELTFRERLDHLKCRLGAFRMKYTVEPGLYSVGTPGKDSEVFVSANYKLSFDALRVALKGMDAWILVLDTKGINVWCAAGKGTFGTEELVRRVFEARLFEAVSHRRLIVPQLGAPGVAAHDVKRQTDFHVLYGPVRATDIGSYLASNYTATKEMRTVRFDMYDRLVLTPMELLPALRIFAIYALGISAVFGVSPDGISFERAVSSGAPFVALGLLSVSAGAFLTPLLLPYIPSRSFALKGWLAGFLAILAAFFITRPATGTALILFTFIFFPLASSYVALQFTGSTAFTGVSGVKLELKYSIPVYAAGAAVSVVLLAAFKLNEWGLI